MAQDLFSQIEKESNIPNSSEIETVLSKLVVEILGLFPEDISGAISTNSEKIQELRSGYFVQFGGNSILSVELISNLCFKFPQLIDVAEEYV